MRIIPVSDCWRFLAQYFQDEPEALFEIFPSELPVQGNWFPTALLVGTIRAQHPASLIFLGNGTAQSDPAGLPVRYRTGEPVPNVVYAIRVSTQQLSFDERSAISALAKSSAVFASEWSVDASERRVWLSGSGWELSGNRSHGLGGVGM